MLACSDDPRPPTAFKNRESVARSQVASMRRRSLGERRFPIESGEQEYSAEDYMNDVIHGTKRELRHQGPHPAWSGQNESQDSQQSINESEECAERLCRREASG